MDIINKLIASVIIILKGLGLPGGFLLITLESFMPFLPLAMFIGLNVSAFGWFGGFIISYIGAICGSLISYFFFYYLSDKKYVKKFIHGNEKINYYADKFHHIKLSTLSLCLVNPFLPAFAFNIAAGLVKMSKRKFITALVIGKVFIIYFWGYVGESLIDSFTNLNTLFWLLIVFVVVYFISKWVSSKFNLE